MIKKIICSRPGEDFSRHPNSQKQEHVECSWALKKEVTIESSLEKIYT